MKLLNNKNLSFIFFTQIHAIFTPISFLFILVISYFLDGYLPITRYDFISISVTLIHGGYYFLIYRSRLSPYAHSKHDIIVIILFHILGFIFEVFKTSHQINLWSYPEAGVLKILGVPWYSGFMYGAFCDFLVINIKRFRVEVKKMPSILITLTFCFILYAHFFLKHWKIDKEYVIGDLRYILGIMIIFIFFRTKFFIQNPFYSKKYPLVFLCFFIGFIVWIAENIMTIFGAWRYSEQANSWQIVDPQIILSWTLLGSIPLLLLLIKNK